MAAFPRERIIREIKPRCRMKSSIDKRRNRMLGKVMIAAALLAVGFPSNTSGQTPTRIRLATLIPSGTSYHHSLQEMGEKWKQSSNGALTLTIYADGTMGSEADIVRRMRIGQLQ